MVQLVGAFALRAGVVLAGTELAAADEAGACWVDGEPHAPAPPTSTTEMPAIANMRGVTDSPADAVRTHPESVRRPLESQVALECGIGEALLDGVEEACGIGAVDQPMVVGQG